MSRPIGDRRVGRLIMVVLWPAFLMATVAEGVFFSMIDPHELVVVGLHLADSREAAYTVGFFVFWLLFATGGGLTCLLMQTTGSPPTSLLKTPEDRAHQDKALIGR
jgi:hypothetical protein